MKEESQTSLVHHLRFGLTLPVMLMLAPVATSKSPTCGRVKFPHP